MCLTVALQTIILLALLNTTSASDQNHVGPLRLEVLQLTTKPFSGLLTRFNGAVGLQMRVTNQTDAPLMLNRAQLNFLCEDGLCRHSRPSQPNLFTDDQVELSPGETLEGWVAFQVVRPDSTEPSMKLTWQISDATQSISLNQVLRNLINARTVHVGYENRITVLSIDRTVDLMTMWVLDEQFRSLREQGVERLVLVGGPGESTRLPSKISNWLRQANRTAVTNHKVVVRGFPVPVQFHEFHVAGFQYGSSTAGQIMHRSRDQAVAAAAKTLYERLSTEAAVAELTSSEFGIRRAAMESSIDRLPSADLGFILESVKSAHSADRQLVLEMLDRVSNPLGLMTLRTILLSYLELPLDTSDSFAPATAEVAARTLVRCIVPKTHAALKEVWAAAKENESLQQTIIREVLRTDDHRWTKLAAEFATKQLDHFSVDRPTKKTTPNKSTRNDVASRVLRDVLRFLHTNDELFINVARQRLLHVTAPEIQDELLQIVVDSGEVALTRDCINRRLEQGAITKILLDTIHQLPDSAWSTQLFRLLNSKDLARQYRASTLMTAVRCATDDQLDMMIDGVDNLDRTTRGQLFQQLIGMNHPRCAELLQKSLAGDETEFSTALSSLRFRISPEILQLVVDRYEVFRQTAIEHGKLEGSKYRMATKLLAQLGSIDHPEARRMINLSLISPELGLRDEAIHQMQRSDSRSRTRNQKPAVWKLKKDKQFGTAMTKVNQLIERDPFYADFLMIRAALNLRNDQVAAALSDIQQADRLSPGDVITESTLALAQVRLGHIESGLEYAETVLQQVPHSGGQYYSWTLYNTACVYARAIELSDVSAANKQRYLDRAIELMHQSADAGIHDESHVLDDPDLVTLHNHPDWSTIIGKITTNQKKKE